MIVAIDFSDGYACHIHDSDRYLDELPEDLVRIGEMLALEDFVAHGPRPVGYASVHVSVLDAGSPSMEPRHNLESVPWDALDLCL
jgi:hypothetical protein